MTDIDLQKTNPSKMTGIKRHNIERVFSFLGAKENTVDPDGVVELEVTSSGLGKKIRSRLQYFVLTS